MIGVDVGGTKILAGLVERDGTVVAHNEYPTPVESRGGTARRARGRGARAARTRRVVAVGFGIPSQIDQRTGVALGSVNIPLQGVPFRDTMATRLELPVGIDNDANAAAIAEWHAGAGRGTTDMLMLTLGTGVGGGLILGGRPYRGWFGAGAEIGHMVIVHDGVRCRCGGYGHLESYVSGKAADELAARAFGPAADAHRLVRLAREGDAKAVEILKGIGRAPRLRDREPRQHLQPGADRDRRRLCGRRASSCSSRRKVVADRETLPSVRDSYRIVRAELGTWRG